MRHSINKNKYSSILLLMALALSQAACSLLPEAQSLRMFNLPIQSGAVSSTDDVLPLQLRVRTFQAQGLLAGSRIMVMPGGSEVSAYRGVRWTVPVPTLLRDRLLEAFKTQGRLEAVYSEANRLQADVELSGVLKVFQSEYVDEGVQVRIQADLSITDASGRQLLANRRFEVRDMSRNESIEEVVASFGRAGDTLSRQVSEWALREIATSAN